MPASMARIASLILLVLLLAACTAPPTVMAPPGPQAAAIIPSQTPASTSTPGPAFDPSITPSASASPAAPLCSPLEGYSLQQIPALVSNPYDPPPPGSDDPHAGVDLDDMLPGSRIALPGRAVQAVWPGTVAAIVRDRFPFGNALIIETPLETLPPAWQETRPIPTRSLTPAPASALTCPPFEIPAGWDGSRRSLYTLYAHLENPPVFLPGDAVTCGQVLGAVGQSGNALNPHLHLEERVGPSGARLGSLSHYDSSATQAELSAYCAWTVSGWFQLVDPLRMLDPRP